MGKYRPPDAAVLEARIARGLIVQEFGPDDVDALNWIAHESPADTTELHR